MITNQMDLARKALAGGLRRTAQPDDADFHLSGRTLSTEFIRSSPARRRSPRPPQAQRCGALSCGTTWIAPTAM
ncbi:hypothetical protein KCP78_09615 [Salmonella enterica subsp. enterica]|nr:hypothetical protein KCP78_09615 [Salmonella enterica subsp. enterica]